MVNGAYKFIWYDLNKEPWYTFERGSGKDFQNTHRWVSNKCIARDGYYSDWETTLYHQYNTDLNQDWAALVEIRKFYEIVTPQF